MTANHKEHFTCYICYKHRTSSWKEKGTGNLINLIEGGENGRKEGKMVNRT